MDQPDLGTKTYYPGRGDGWEERKPEDVGVESGKLQSAIDFSREPARMGYPCDLPAFIPAQCASMPNDDGAVLGPTKEHGPVTGVVLRHGFILAEWGEPDRADMTFSVTKSFLSTVAGLGWERGLIEDVHQRLQETVRDGGFDSPHNARITWDHMLRQTSEWHGSLWDKDTTAGNTDGDVLEPVQPGSRYEYNDVRVNRLALALLRLWQRPLPEVLGELVMDPIGASDTWRWHGYSNSWVDIEGTSIQSVSGGGHWGGGMWISARDLARFGYLTLRDGRWAGRQIIPKEWIRMSRTPGELNTTYGYMNYFLNTGRSLFPSGPEGNFYHGGAGANRVWVDSDHDLVVVIRWLDGEHFDGFVKRILSSLV
jgi:hypothetical protein